MRLQSFAIAALAATLCTLTLGLGGTALADKKPTTQEWVDSLRSVKVDGAELVLLDHGSGDPVVMIHGSMEDYRCWLGQIDALASEHRVITYSRRYHFPNQGGGDGRDYSMVLHEKDLLAILDALHLDKVSLVGHSYGATLATRFTIDHPERVKALVVVEPTFPALMAGTERDSQFVADRREVNERARQALMNDFPELGAEAVAEWAFGPQGLDLVPRVVRARLAQNARSLKLQFLTTIKDEPIGCAPIQSIKCPVLYVDGARSPWHAHSMAEAFAKCRPETRRVTIKNATHGMMWTDAKAFNRSVGEFLAHPALAND